MESVAAEVLISNYSGLSTRLLSLRVTNDLCDVQLQVGVHTFNAHKLILCASSDVFKTMLTNQKWTEAHKQSVVLVEDPLCESVFDKFVYYIYSGQLYISHSTVCPLLTLADKYNVQEMIPLCRSYMRENLNAPLSSSCVLQWWENANMRNDTELESIILDYIECNFSKVIRTPDFLSAGLETVEKLIASSKLVVENEAVILCAVMIWLQAYVDFHQPSVLRIRELFGRLTRHIRWPMMTENELKCLLQCSDFQNFLQSYGLFLQVPNVLGDQAPSAVHTVKEPAISSVAEVISSLPSSFQGINCTTTVQTYTPVSFYILSCLASRKKQPSSSSGSKHRQISSPVKRGRCDEQENNLCMSRAYTSDYWCTSLTVSDFLAFPQYGTQTFFFSTPRTGYRHDDGQTLDWEVELCPKGVHYPPAILIGLGSGGNLLVDEAHMQTVRLSVMSRSPHELPLKVEVNVLVKANCLGGSESSFVERCHRRTCIFDSRHQRHNLDDVVPFQQLGTYLRPDGSTPELYLTPTVAFTVSIIIRPLPLHHSV